MKAVLQLFWQICRLKQSPEYVPTQTWFVLLVIAANLICSAAVSLSAEGAPGLLTTINSIVVGQTTTAALVWVALNLRDMGGRFLATITALFGCDLIITAVFALILPLTLLAPTMAPVLFLLFVAWSVSVAGFILHRALQVPLALGIVVALGMSVLSLALSQLAIGA